MNESISTIIVVCNARSERLGIVEAGVVGLLFLLEERLSLIRAVHIYL